MRALKAFAISFLLCSLILFTADHLMRQGGSEALWIRAEQDEVTVSVKDDRSLWQEGLTAGVGEEASLTDRIHLTHIGKMDSEGRLKVMYSVTDDEGSTENLIRTVKFTDYTAPELTMLRDARYTLGATVVLADLIMVTDPLEGDITHLVQIVRSDLDVNKVGEYEMELTVETSYGVRADYTLTVKIV